MHRESFRRRFAHRDGRAGDEGIGEEVCSRVVRVEIRRVFGSDDIEQAVGDRLGCQEGEVLEQLPSIRGQSIDRSRSRRGEAGVVIVAHQCLVEPAQHRRALFAPELQITLEADVLDGDVRAGLL